MRIGHYTDSWFVDSFEIPAPTDISFGHEGIQSKESGRAEDGYMYKVWVRDDVSYVDITYEALTGNEKDAIWFAMRGRDFMFTYYDNGTCTIGSAYCNKFTYDGYSRHICEDDGGLYRNISFRVVEN